MSPRLIILTVMTIGMLFFASSITAIASSDTWPKPTPTHSYCTPQPECREHYTATPVPPTATVPTGVTDTPVPPTVTPIVPTSTNSPIPSTTPPSTATVLLTLTSV